MRPFWTPTPRAEENIFVSGIQIFLRPSVLQSRDCFFPIMWHNSDIKTVPEDKLNNEMFVTWKKSGSMMRFWKRLKIYILETSKLCIHFKTNNLFNTSMPNVVCHILKIDIKFNIYWNTFFLFSYKRLLLICIPNNHHIV